MKKTLLLTVFIVSIGTANAQWHFSITSMSYNDNCSGLQAMMEVEVNKTVANTYAAKEYSSKEECESMRSRATMNWSNSGCYIRTTTSPCTGGNIGGGGADGFGINSQDGVSQFNSIAIGEPYFSPNEAYAVSSMGQDLEIKLEALNKSYNSAVNGIKTGDQLFDDIYRRQVKELPKPNNENNNGPYTLKFRNEIIPNEIVPNETEPDETDPNEVDPNEIDPNSPLYVINSNSREQVNIENENDYSYDNDDIIVPIDIERFNNLEEEAIWWAKPFNNSFPNDEEGLVSALYDFASSTYKVGSGFIKDGLYKVNDAVNYLETEYDIKVPYSEKIGEFGEYLEQADMGMKVAGKAFVGDIVGATAEFANEAWKKAMDKAIDPLKDCAAGLILSITESYNLTKKMLNFRETMSKSYNDTMGGIKKASQAGIQGENPEAIWNKYIIKTEQKDINTFKKGIHKQIVGN